MTTFATRVMFCKMNYILYELIIYRAFVVRRREMARNPIDDSSPKEKLRFWTLRGYRMMDKLDEQGWWRGRTAKVVGWLVNRSNAGCCSRVQVLARGEWISIVSTPSLQATGNHGLTRKKRKNSLLVFWLWLWPTLTLSV